MRSHRSIKIMLDTLERHARAHEMAGSAHPDDQDKIKQDYFRTRARIEKRINELINQPKITASTKVPRVILKGNGYSL